MALVLVLGMLTTVMVAFGSVAAAQTTNAQLAFVNGTSTDPVSVTANGATVASDLAFAATSDFFVGEGGDYEIVYSDGSTLTGPIPSATAWAVVSGYGAGDATAAAYQVNIAEIPDGKGVVVVWNAQTVDSVITVDGAQETVPPGGRFGSPLTVDAGTTVAVNVDGVDASVAPAADEYIDVFGVSDVDAAAVGVAQAVIPSMTALLEALEPTPPPADPKVPDVAGQSAADATATLVAAGYDVAERTEASDSVEAGIAIRTEPAAGTELAAGSTVTLVVSSGSATVAVPDVVGKPVDDAVNEIESAGLATSIQEQTSEEVEAGIVIETNPRGGVDVAPGSEVIVVVSTGPEDVTVPDFLGMTVEEAEAAAEAAGLVVSFIEDPDDPDPNGFVVDQDPAAGEVVAAGSEVMLQLSPATEDAWASIKVEPGGILKAGGINFEPGSVSEVSVLDTNLVGKGIVEENGYWLTTIDITSLDPNLAYEVLVVGTAEDGSTYENSFKLPPTGETVVEPEPDEGVPTWVWFVLGGLLIAAIVIGIVLYNNHNSASTTTAAADTAAGASDEASAPPASDAGGDGSASGSPSDPSGGPSSG
jgi:beta-lactam-binding protein with PASTA domain